MRYLERAGELANQKACTNYGFRKVLANLKLYLKCPILLLLKYVL